MKSSPLILNSLDDPGHRLVRIEAKPNDPKDEAWLQELLYSHSELLPVDEFDDAYSPAIPIGREVSTERGPIDNLYVSPEGGITVLETKLWKNPEKHRTVVAQVIDYAKELATWEYDQLCSAVLASSRKRREDERTSLEEKLGTALSNAGVELHEFQENVAACLAEGSFLLLIVGDRISPNIALLTKAIQSAPGLDFTLGLAEMQLYEMTVGDEWPLIVVPEVVGRTVEKSRGVVHVRYIKEKPHVDVDVEDEDGGGPSMTQKLDLDLFLRQIPKDLVEPYKKGIEEWEKIGGTIRFTNQNLYFEKEVAGQNQKCVRCDTNRVAVMGRKAVDQWSGNPTLYEDYLDTLDAAPILSQHARSDKKYIKHAALSADDLSVLLQAARKVVQQVQSEE